MHSTQSTLRNPVKAAAQTTMPTELQTSCPKTAYFRSWCLQHRTGKNQGFKETFMLEDFELFKFF